MNTHTSFLLVPNHSVMQEGDSIIMESAETDMLKTVSEKFARLGMATFEMQSGNTSLSGRLDKSAIRFHRLSLFEHDCWVHKIINYIRALLLLPFVLRKYDVIYIFCPGHCGFLAALWSRLLRKTYGLYVRGTWLNKNRQTSFWWRLVFKGAKFMIVTGESFKKKLEKYCESVVNEVPLTVLTPKQVDVTGLDERSRCRMIFVGRLSETKGVRDVIRAVALLKEQGVDSELLVAGGGTREELEALNTMIGQFDVVGRIKLLGHLSPMELARAYKSSSLFVFPSYYAEGFPRVLYEAMMYAMAIVTCEMPGTEGFLIDGKNCIYTPPKKPEILAKNLNNLLSNAELTRKIANCARKDVELVYGGFMDKSHAHQIFRLLNR